LVVTADDFGLAVEVNDAVEAAHRVGILSAASLMVSGPAASDAIARAKAIPSLRVGLHLVLADGRPALPPERIPGLVDSTGALRSDLARFGAEIACRRELQRQLRAEISAQFFAFERSGFRLDHVSVHRHFHLHPIIAREVIAIGQRFGMRSLRVPNEPRGPLKAAKQGTSLSCELLRPWVALLADRTRRAGLMTADAVFGLAWSGALTPERLAALIGHLPPGFIEIYLHPAIANEFPGHARDYRYDEEYKALRAPAVIQALRQSGFELGGYSDALMSTLLAPIGA
jgi:hopanoid biosynthesis associated protein HpnK